MLSGCLIILGIVILFIIRKRQAGGGREKKEWTLFLTFLKIGAFTFGGGYGMVSLVRETVISNGWLTESEFLNFIAVSESTPGPLAPDPKSILVFAILWLTHFGYKRIKKTASSPIIMILFSAALGMLLLGV